MLSKSCLYGVRAAMYVASLNQKEYVPIAQIADTLSISFHFLTKILQQLTEFGIMNSYRGPKGGVMLAKPVSEIKLVEIVEAIDGKNLFNECIFGLPGCGDSKPCPLHAEWAILREKIHMMFKNASLAMLAERINSMNFRITEDDLLETVQNLKKKKTG